jgi:hypothetical protein
LPCVLFWYFGNRMKMPVCERVWQWPDHHPPWWFPLFEP